MKATVLRIVIRLAALGTLAFAAGYMASAESIPIGFLSWDVTIPGSAGQFDIANETGNNSSGDTTFPVTGPVTLTGFGLLVNFSDGSSQTFGSSYFTLDPLDMLSFEGKTLPIGGANPKPIGATLTGSFATTDLTVFDGSQVTVSPDFTAGIPNGSPLADGALAIINAETGGIPTTPEPATWVLTVLAVAGLLFVRKVGRRSTHLNGSSLRGFATLVGCAMLLNLPIRAQVKMNVSTIPSAGVAGVSFVGAIGSGFPTSHGAILPANVTITLAGSCGGAAVATAAATNFTAVIGSSARVAFQLPASLATGNYFVTLSGTTSDGTSFASNPGSCSEVAVTHTNPTLAACIPTSSLAVNAPPNGGTVTAYAPNGCWSCGTTGVQAVVIEGSGSNASIPTPSVTNSCSSNPATGQTVCVANNTDVYLISGSAVTNTLHSGSNAFASFSGGSCQNCGVAINALTNQAVIAMGLTPSPSTSGIQFLDLNTNVFNPPAPAASRISEDISIDPTRGFILSPNETSNYTLFSFTGAGAITEFGRPITPFQELDSAAEDCSTGIALSSSEGTSNIFITDLTQATFTAGSPGTWNAPGQIVTLTGASFSAGTSGISVAQGTDHLGIVTGEFGGSSFAALQLPSTSGSGTPNLVDYAFVTAITGISAGLDPHTITAYTSPNNGKAYGLMASGAPPTALARIDLACVLALPRVPGTHTVSGSAASCINIIPTPGH
jgi:hypothetical protein